uniref:Uncharacterized protein n=1 Tax=Rhizophora mucronata TaxID=61149 RepID=A0A2P2PM90_RHIMU
MTQSTTIRLLELTCKKPVSSLFCIRVFGSSLPTFSLHLSLNGGCNWVPIHRSFCIII